MNEEIRKYLDDVFKEAPKTRAAYEVKEELLANSNERYFDLVAEGVQEKEALEIVIESIGDVKQLFPAVAKDAGVNQISEETLKKMAFYKAIAVSLYIIGFAIMVAFDSFVGLEELGFVLMLVMAAFGTGILVYVANAYPKYKKVDDTLVEEFKEWNANQKVRKSVQSSVNVIIWMVVLILYFLISFATRYWELTWIIFLIGACAQAIANLWFQLKNH